MPIEATIGVKAAPAATDAWSDQERPVIPGCRYNFRNELVPDVVPDEGSRDRVTFNPSP